MSEEQKRLIDVPAEILAANVVSSMIKARGVINLWDAMILRLIVDMRKEAADDLALATSARAAQEAEYPTKAMLDAGLAEYDVWDAATAGIHVRKIYMAMRAAIREEGK